MADYSEYPKDPRQQPEIDTDALMDFISPTLRRSDEYAKEYKKGLEYRSPQFWITPEGQKEKEALIEPSIMDEYIKEKDPEQWGRIKSALDQKYIEGLGTAIGTGKVPGLKGTAAMPEVLPAVKSAPAIRPQFQKIREILPGMYSKAEAIIENKMGGSATPQQIGGMLREAKPEELEYLGIPQFLEGKNKVTREEMLEHIRSNLPEIQALPVKGRIDEKGIADLEDRILKLDEEFRKSKHEKEIYEYEFLLSAEKDHKLSASQWKKVIDLVNLDDGHPVSTLEDLGINLSEESLAKLEKYAEKSKESTNIGTELNFAESALFELRDVAPVTKFDRSSLVLPGGKSYEEHLFQYNPKNIVKRDKYSLSKEGAKIYDDYENQIQNLYNEQKYNSEQLQKAASREMVEKAIAPEMAEFEKTHQLIRSELDPLFSQNKKIENEFLEKIKNSNIDNILYQIILKNFNNKDYGDVLDNLKYGLENKQLSKEIYDYFNTNILGNSEFQARQKRMKELTDVLNILDEEAHKIKAKEYDKLSYPFRVKNNRLQDKIYELERARTLALSPHIKNPYYGSHWDESNVFAHTRTNERIGPQGEKHLFAEELQSDWQQGIRDFKNKIELAKQESSPQQVKFLERELAEKPKAPLEKAWPEFLSKRLLHEAATKDVDNISWTTGSQQSDRYNFTKQLSQITYDTKNQILIAYGKKGGQVIREPNIPPEKLEEYIGKDLTKKLLQTPKKGVFDQEGNIHSLEGDDLKIESAGMKGFYDEIIPSFMSKMGKKFGVKPEKIVLPEAGEVWTMKLTPEMKASILKEKFPLFTGAGAALTGGLMSKEAEASMKEDKNLQPMRFRNLKRKVRK
jgi:hypothetical protein